MRIRPLDLKILLEINVTYMVSRQYSIKRGVATQNIEELVKQGLDLLYNQLDNLMKIFKRRDPQFYQGYILARTIVDD